MKKTDEAVSKFLTWALRHHPEKAGLKLDVAGWTPVEDVLWALAGHFGDDECDLTRLKYIVSHCPKQRFSLVGGKIRANQGHSVTVELDHPIAVPPSILYHGTPQRFVPAIQDQGLKKMQRHAVHLSTTIDRAIEVGARRGKAAIFEVMAMQMHNQGHVFRVTPNEVWLVEAVPPTFLRYMKHRPWE